MITPSIPSCSERLSLTSTCPVYIKQHTHEQLSGLQLSTYADDTPHTQLSTADRPKPSLMHATHGAKAHVITPQHPGIRQRLIQSE